MSHTQTKCIIILSTKSAGSSALQNLLAKYAQINHVAKTRHFENETLFWVKAASVLGLPQVEMLNSEVPISRDKARTDLINLLRDNLEVYPLPATDDELIFGGWRLLCQKYAPIFLEKSPHHLHQWSALELILECMRRLREVDFLIVGLIRNPMDALYSMWRRWRDDPELHQYEWFTAYHNLLKLKELIGDKLVVVRYEDMVSDPSCLKEIYEFIGAPTNQESSRYLHGRSVGKWKKDKYYGFKLGDEVARLAEKFGYDRQEISNDSSLFWPSHRYLSGSLYRGLRLIKFTFGSIKTHHNEERLSLNSEK